MLRSFFFAFAIVSPDDGFHQAVTHYVFFVELDMSYSIDISQYARGFFQTTALVFRKVNLCKVASNDRFGIGADTGQEHLYLQVGSILRFIQNDKGMIKGTTTHI